ncbi:MAG: heparinase II/III family protein, partial [Chloroflexota bacterium]
MLRRIPLHAYPSLIRYALRRRLQGNRPPPPPELSSAELDFFFGGTGAVEQRLANSTFRFFSPSDFSGSGLYPRLLADCDSILARRLELLGQTVDLGNPITWRRDFRTGYEWPREHISKLKLVTRDGDVKVPWELSRFHHGLTLALGFAATGDERYPREWRAQVDSWRADNPPEHGPNWGNAMEAAIRAVNWIAAFEFTRSGPAFDRAACESILKALIQHGRFIASHLEEYWPPTNHILSNYCGLIWLGLFCSNDLSRYYERKTEADRWLALGLRGLAQQLRLQILPDGASYEASTAYHRFVTGMVTSTVRLCELNDVWAPPAIKNTALKMAQVVEGLQKPDGTLPLFGDEDGGRWLWPHLLPRPPATPPP